MIASSEAMAGGKTERICSGVDRIRTDTSCWYGVSAIAEMAEILAALGPAFLVQNALLGDLDPDRLMTGFEGLLAANLRNE
ncbi:hypothetical protein JOF56_002270 [Kibdelosporangium banguiense]|uniref:Uncharacterized protein n=1 Tax=Kibdelosporangium banguiense TaxID=1365924 RepID=A0ABS4TBU1_9PSEU|nr:hypothetical protein [Kibdelosporangium banguiense]